MSTAYDVVIAGGGMVGISLALALAHGSQGQLRTLVVERNALPPATGEPAQRPQYRPSFDARSTALSRSSEQIFGGLGLWPELAQHAAAITHIHVSQRHHWGHTGLHASDQGWDSLGHVIENSWLGQVLLAALRRAPGVSLAAPAEVSVARWSGDAVHLELRHPSAPEEPPSPLQARLLCVADGADSGLCRQLGIETQRTHYPHTALIANIGSANAHAGRAFERFTRNGPLALLPLPDDAASGGRSALVWSLPEAQAQQMRDCPSDVFLDALQQAFGWRQGRLLRVGRRDTYPLARILAREQVRSRLVVLGNAAHSLHPVAGQGFNLALRDVAQLAGLLGPVARAGTDIGALKLLRSYAERQAADQAWTIALSDLLPRLFDLRLPLAGSGRGLGLALLDALPGPRRHFTRAAAGCSRPLP